MKNPLDKDAFFNGLKEAATALNYKNVNEELTFAGAEVSVNNESRIIANFDEFIQAVSDSVFDVCEDKSKLFEFTLGKVKNVCLDLQNLIDVNNPNAEGIGGFVQKSFNQTSRFVSVLRRK